ncbi:hypothetical protein TetV_049 [Tetraselmis virus 1]|uniref:Uncharacterized protein n=1 Tax=Tetraselmis virus 1 TaxID=2060617 RepID=A0A2P0VMN1_9VIRU|nr:hypothetical protein QJ968_gp049 [Tetraselmis virus 1]AUF82141.1 hypothetical protein TetV_049 [Tetraselmis virus 1]
MSYIVVSLTALVGLMVFLFALMYMPMPQKPVEEITPDNRFSVPPSLYTVELSNLESDALAARPLDAYPASLMRKLVQIWHHNAVQYDVLDFYKHVIGSDGLDGTNSLDPAAISDKQIRYFFEIVGIFYRFDSRAPYEVSTWKQSCDIPDNWNPLYVWLLTAKYFNRRKAARDYVMWMWAKMMKEDKSSYKYKRYLNFNSDTLSVLMTADPGFGDLKIIRDQHFPN